MTSLPLASARLDAVPDASFDHFAIATRRIRDLTPLWIDCLGGTFRMGADNASMGWRTARIEFAGAMCVELIEPLAGSAFFDSFFRRNRAGGLHHVTFLVDDVEDAFARLADRGYEPFGAHEQWHELFVHPKHANGVLVQLMPRRSYRAPEMTLEDLYAGRGLMGTGLLSP
jgi:methylmalonyl-CoA/ethylmalonyl-CoA epimerase